MRRAAPLAALLLSGCASWSGLRPGPTSEGVAVRVSARDKAGARREAVEAVLPLFLSPAQRREKASVVESAALAKADAFTGRARLPKKGPAVVETRLEELGAALLKAGLVRPAGYEAGPELTLIVFGDRAAGPTGAERFAADAFETALFARGIEAKDADDPLIPLARRLKAKTEAGAAAEAAAQGWAWIAAGRLASEAGRDPESAAWRARARLSLALYAAPASSAPARVETSGEAVDVSSGAAASRAIEDAVRDAAAAVEKETARAREGRATIAVFLEGAKDPAYLFRVVRDLRRVPGVAGAALFSWHGLDDMPVVHAYVKGLRADLLAASLLRQDASLRVGAVETEDGRITLEGPEVPMSEDRGD